MQVNEFEKPQGLNEQFFTSLHKELESCGFKNICKVTDQRLAVLMDTERGKTEIQSVLKQLGQEYPLTVTVGEGGTAHRVEELHPSYMMAEGALDYKMFRGKGKWILEGRGD